MTLKQCCGCGEEFCGVVVCTNITITTDISRIEDTTQLQTTTNAPSPVVNNALYYSKSLHGATVISALFLDWKMLK